MNEKVSTQEKDRIFCKVMESEIGHMMMVEIANLLNASMINNIPARGAGETLIKLPSGEPKVLKMDFFVEAVLSELN